MVGIHFDTFKPIFAEISYGFPSLRKKVEASTGKLIKVCTSFSRKFSAILIACPSKNMESVICKFYCLNKVNEMADR